MKIREIKENFQMDVGAPSPKILSNELYTYLIFYKDIDYGLNGNDVHVRSDNDEGIITIKFNHVTIFKFGSPNDEAIEGHKYYKLGLMPYAIHELESSDWIQELKQANKVHPYHSDKPFSKMKHYIFFFHDTCLEIVCNNYEVLNNTSLTMKEEVIRISKLL